VLALEAGSLGFGSKGGNSERCRPSRVGSLDFGPKELQQCDLPGFTMAIVSVEEVLALGLESCWPWGWCESDGTGTCSVASFEEVATLGWMSYRLRPTIPATHLRWPSLGSRRRYRLSGWVIVGLVPENMRLRRLRLSRTLLRLPRLRLSRSLFETASASAVAVSV
jgi:hypothetical protein